MMLSRQILHVTLLQEVVTRISRYKPAISLRRIDVGMRTDSLRLQRSKNKPNTSTKSSTPAAAFGLV
ncbi:hypothetical protein OESDEN_06767 [Oesophagostomum dentatum]|uniref:Uncharacterized protein n=1 Tax=Oesophagostomum dentatum TaxID=61180 RepID=A0A0B1TBX0_OESDE|nr:hypothetical protein OESDEN_06767 [Oesophagostomum dentatum]